MIEIEFRFGWHGAVTITTYPDKGMFKCGQMDVSTILKDVSNRLHNQYCNDNVIFKVSTKQLQSIIDHPKVKPYY